MKKITKIKPQPITPGDSIGIVAPAGAIKELPMLTRAIKTLKNKGYIVKQAEHLRDKKWYLAGPDNHRLQDLMNFFIAPEIKAIFCARGGYGTMRLIESIDYQIIKNNPKILLGYSDITALHSAINKYSGLVTFHGPLAVSDFGKPKPIDFTWKNTWDLLEGNIKTPYEIKNFIEPITINPGRVEGELIGGNLAMLCAILGTKYSPDYHNKILFIEDIGESLYRLDRYLTQLKLAGVFNLVNGIIFGEFSDIVKSDEEEVNKLSILEIIQDIIKDIKTPAIYGFSCGHSENKSTLAVGVNCELNCDTGVLKIIEPIFNYTDFS